MSEPEGSFVSFEVLDDLAVESADGTQKLVQSKSALATNPMSDHAVAFWKTLANWCDAISTNAVDVQKLKLVIYVSHERSGDISSRFAAAKTDADAKAAIEAAKLELWGAGPSYPLRKDVAVALAPHVERFFGADEVIQTSIVRLLEIETGSGAPQRDLRELFLLVPKDRLEQAVLHACGWVQDNVNTLIGEGKPAILSRDAFHTEMVAYVRRHAERAILQSFAPESVPTDKAVELLPKVFVRQLQLIGLDFEAQMEAISDYFRASIDRTHWGETAQVHESSFKELDASLKRTWTNQKIHTAAAHSAASDESQGQILYAGCMATNELVENLTPPNHFVPGCFHMLADEQTVGWHPKFKALLVQSPVSQGTQT